MAPKKATKRDVGKRGPHRQANDAMRTFEHLGRVQALHGLINSESEALSLLMNLADDAFRATQYKESADLLRAAEHLSFATLHAGFTEVATPGLRDTIAEEVERLVEQATEHGPKHSPEPLQRLHARFRRDAEAALRRGSYRAALEFGRGADALSHVDRLETQFLPSSVRQKRLLG